MSPMSYNTETDICSIYLPEGVSVGQKTFVGNKHTLAWKFEDDRGYAMKQCSINTQYYNLLRSTATSSLPLVLSNIFHTFPNFLSFLFVVILQHSILFLVPNSDRWYCCYENSFQHNPLLVEILPNLIRKRNDAVYAYISIYGRRGEVGWRYSQ